MSLEQKDLELIERIVYKNGDDIAVSIGRSFERLEERMDAIESRNYSRIAEVEDRVDDTRQALADALDSIKEDVRDLVRETD